MSISIKIITKPLKHANHKQLTTWL